MGMLFTSKDETLSLRGNIHSQASIQIKPFPYHPAATFDLHQTVDIWIPGSCPPRRGAQEQPSHRSSRDKFFLLLSGSLANPPKGYMTALPPRVGDHAHVPFLNAKMQATKGKEKCKRILLALSFVFCLHVKIQQVQYICSLALQPIISPFCKSVCTSVCLSCCNSYNSNHSQPL